MINKDPKPWWRATWEFISSVGLAVIVALSVRAFLIEPYKIPSSSMVPNLLIGDNLFVNKSAFGVRIPFTTKWLFQREAITRGDVVVFKYPGLDADAGKDFIKRIVGLPGDDIVVTGHDVSINGIALHHTVTGTPVGASNDPTYIYYTESNGDRTYVVRYHHTRDTRSQRFTVPAHSYFAMGDNRNNSKDSRVWGAVPESHLKGKALFIWLPRNCSPSGYGYQLTCDGLRTERFGQWIN